VVGYSTTSVGQDLWSDRSRTPLWGGGGGGGQVRKHAHEKVVEDAGSELNFEYDDVGHLPRREEGDKQVPYETDCGTLYGHLRRRRSRKDYCKSQPS
jgi:hypothetical protein